MDGERKQSDVVMPNSILSSEKQPNQPGSRRMSKRVSIVIGANETLWASNRRESRLSKKLSQDAGITNPTFVQEELPITQVHLGHDELIRRKSFTYLKKEMEIDYHAVNIDTLYARLGSDPDEGLDDNQILVNKEKYGKNELTPPEKEPLWLQFLRNLVGGFQLLLWAGSILSFAAYIVQAVQSSTPPPDNLYLAIVLAVLVIVLGLFTFYQEYSSGKIMESFTKMIPQYANVIRNGKLEVINANELAVGDIVNVKFGDRVPADIRIIESSGFKVDNSSLTGESDPQLRIPECTDENPMETKNLAFFSTNALEGTCKGIVVSVGDATFIGRIAGLASGLDATDTPLAREVEYFIKLISAVACFFATTFFTVSLLMGYKYIDAVLFLIGIIVANVPEGLLVTFTVILALTAKKMADKMCLVKQLQAVETLGSTTVICSDKTGTLTQNLMSVSHMWYNNLVKDIETARKPDFDKSSTGWNALSRVATLCSRASFLNDPETINLPIKQRKITGDASEAAILRFTEEMIGNVDKYQANSKKVFEIPFNSTNKWQISIHDMTSSGEQRRFIAMKGAPERIIKYCTTILIGEKEHEMDEIWKNNFNKMCEELGGLGERVLGFCDGFLPLDKYPHGYEFNEDEPDFLDIGLRFVGLLSMVDPPRPGVPEAVASCRTAGIKVVMVTGDHPITARAIARGVGIISENNETLDERAARLGLDPYDVDATGITAIVVKGDELLEYGTEQLDNVLRSHTEIVFARVSPQQKLVIVEGFQRLRHIVAVTGDGVNDSPALKKANIGIAMGIAGSDVSKQAADMILLDDNFASIVTGVEEGRLIFDNLKKCIGYLLAANTALLGPFICFIIFRIPLPLGTIPMLMITLGTDIFPTISLSYEEPEGDIMKRPPRDPDRDKLVTDKLISYSYGQIGMIEASAGFFTYFVIMGQNGFLPTRLLGIHRYWDSQYVDSLTDSYGQEWTYHQRKLLEHTCWSAFFCTIVICQFANVLVSKCRRASLFSKLFDNWKIFLAMAIELVIASTLVYSPLNVALSFRPIKIYWWLTAIPFFFYIICYDELRRLILRKWDNPWYQKEFTK